MTTRYRVEYALKTHRRDQFIEWIKGLLAVPFVLHTQPAAAYDENPDSRLASMAKSAHERYSDIFRDLEALVLDHSKFIYMTSVLEMLINSIVKYQDSPTPRSKLNMLVPTLSTFFTPLALEAAFKHQDSIRAISSRRFVAPSFNDIRLILNSAQVIALTEPGYTLQLLTFDGDVTLYDDGGSLNSIEASPVISRLLYFLSTNVRIGIVTAAGYLDASRYYSRLSGLIESVASSETLTPTQKSNLIIMGGESNFLFVFDQSSPYHLRYIPRRSWILPTMLTWSEEAIQGLLNVAQDAFRSCVSALQLPAEILRKERAVGIIPKAGIRFTREQLEETVLVVQQIVELSCTMQQATGENPNPNPPIHAHIPFTTFNGGSDVFLDIGDKSLGVQSCQKWFGGIKPGQTLHVGDQFLSGGGNDFKARSACTTSWIASPEETVALLDEIIMREKNTRH